MTIVIHQINIINFVLKKYLVLFMIVNLLVLIIVQLVKSDINAKIKPLNFNNYSDCFNFNPSKPKSYYDNVCSQKFKSNAYYVNNTIGKYDCQGNNVKIKCETYPKKCL